MGKQDKKLVYCIQLLQGTSHYEKFQSGNGFTFTPHDMFSLESRLGFGTFPFLKLLSQADLSVWI